MFGSIYPKFSTRFVVGGCAACFGVALYFLYLKPPPFGRQLQDRLTNDPGLMQRIGGWDTAAFQFTEDKKQDNTFTIKINGRCKGAFVTVSGLYNERRYIITDSAVAPCQ